MGNLQGIWPALALGVLVGQMKAEMTAEQKAPKIKVDKINLSFGGAKVLYDIDLEIKDN